ncbi:enhancer of rudimentary-domain-containing protein [Absidia repens]|uniref:Enhancer of rudimentary-domain-containing protein n=1 Tax=Absidia repens TaxID=90262 RepID=A0A1X2ICZ9_9FUNG|nr:enhancer of rudimentary-domain-containing protein [Absidia repens]
MTAHTILLVQPTRDPASRTYYDCDTVALAMDQVATLYEDRLMEETPSLTQLQYSADDLLSFVDGHKEFVALVFDRNTNHYAPHDHTWIKDRLITHLTNKQRQGQPRPSHNHHHHHSPPSRGRGRGGYGGGQRRY